jgi:hypothetical protein
MVQSARTTRPGYGVVLAVLLSGCWFQESLPPLHFTVINDTDRPMTIWVEADGEEHPPSDGEPTLGPGEESSFFLDSAFATVEDGQACTDGEVIARDDEGRELRFPVACSGDTVRIADD